MNKIIGIRYIGKKDVCEDSVTNSGAVWLPGQVLNFSAKLSAKLLEHATVWEATDVDSTAETFVSGGKEPGQAADPVAYVNLNAMKAPEMALYAKREFNRVIDIDGRKESEVRSDVIRLMSIQTLDELGLQRLAVQDKVAWVTMVTPDEYQALADGLVKVLISPVVKDMPGDQHEAIDDGKAILGEFNEQPPSLYELLESLDKKGLLDLAKQEGKAIDGRLGATQIRALLSEALK